MPNEDMGFHDMITLAHQRLAESGLAGILGTSLNPPPPPPHGGAAPTAQFVPLTEEERRVSSMIGWS